VTPLYSAVPLKSPGTGCLPCVVCGNSTLIDAALAAAATQSMPSVGTVQTSWLTAVKTSDKSVALPWQSVDWTVAVTNNGNTATGTLSVPNTFGGATLTASNYTYSSGAFSLPSIGAGQTVTLTYTTQMPGTLVAPVTDITTVPGYGLLQGAVGVIPMSPSAFVFSNVVRIPPNMWSDWGNLANWTDLYGNAATRLPGANDDVFLRGIPGEDTSSASGTTFARRVIVQPPGGQGVVIWVNLQCSAGLYLTGTATGVEQTSGYSSLRGSTAATVYAYGTSQLLVNPYGASGLAGDCYLYENSGVGPGYVLHGNVTMQGSSCLEGNDSISGNLVMSGNAYTQNSGGNSLVSGNLDVYYPVTRPVPNITVEGTTTYHNYP
jgi:uncharacterized repeat protein (TIGR01451 family)